MAARQGRRADVRADRETNVRIVAAIRRAIAAVQCTIDAVNDGGSDQPPPRLRRSAVASAKAEDPPLLFQHLLEERERAWVARLSEPEHRLLADPGVAVAASDLDQLRHTFILR
jgi:hypothetical protein